VVCVNVFVCRCVCVYWCVSMHISVCVCVSPMYASQMMPPILSLSFTLSPSLYTPHLSPPLHTPSPHTGPQHDAITGSQSGPTGRAGPEHHDGPQPGPGRGSGSEPGSGSGPGHAPGRAGLKKYTGWQVRDLGSVSVSVQTCVRREYFYLFFIYLFFVSSVFFSLNLFTFYAL
jgi:hypothetical protein